MDNRVDEFMESGLLEAFVMGATSEDEDREVLRMKKQHPAVAQELDRLEHDLELLANNMAVPPPPALWARIEDEINGLAVIGRTMPERPRPDTHQRKVHEEPLKGPDYIEVEGANTHMRIHKAWRWAFAAVFVLGKIFLGFAIYYYLENRQAKQNIQDLREEIRVLKGVK
ncbi:hypothetical protein LLH06_06990 [Mucilaginibacter daejeonensis]|uniref:hypothetical protein n=1 Tax=Mucilaginibacter daejeonensis TaxID=398049 RepID=UPI001D178F83|nr:hypothetical protein [Mucilaginibacter daejeonensis]UEG54706.1 hypothetical protein LLH06_06990 [Mucilaginibacter daejeonensis]